MTAAASARPARGASARAGAAFQSKKAARGLKNTLDWASRPYPTNVLRRKPVAVIGASTGFFGAVWAQAELRKILSACGARVLDRQLPVARASDAFAPHGSLADPELTAALAEIVRDLVRRARPNNLRGESEQCDRMRAITAVAGRGNAETLSQSGSTG